MRRLLVLFLNGRRKEESREAGKQGERLECPTTAMRWWDAGVCQFVCVSECAAPLFEGFLYVCIRIFESVHDIFYGRGVFFVNL